MPITAPITLTMTDSKQELEQNVATLCSKRLSDTNFAGTFGHRYQHYVHNSDAADDERNGSYAAEEYGKRR